VPPFVLLKPPLPWYPTSKKIRHILTNLNHFQWQQSNSNGSTRSEALFEFDPNDPWHMGYSWSTPLLPMWGGPAIVRSLTPLNVGKWDEVLKDNHFRISTSKLHGLSTRSLSIADITYPHIVSIFDVYPTSVAFSTLAHDYRAIWVIAWNTCTILRSHVAHPMRFVS
jgi:hypothetical protein